MSENHLPAGSSAELVAAVEKRLNHCFGCGTANPQGLHLEFHFDTADAEHPTATADVELTRLYEGPPGHIHGGIIAALLDEAMGKLNLPLGCIGMTRNMEVDYLRPAPLYAPLKVVGTHLRREGRKLFHQGELVDAKGTVLARAKGLFLVVDRALLGKAGESFRQ